MNAGQDHARALKTPIADSTRSDDSDDLPYCAICDAPFSPEESGSANVCCAECAAEYATDVRA